MCVRERERERERELKMDILLKRWTSRQISPGLLDFSIFLKVFFFKRVLVYLPLYVRLEINWFMFPYFHYSFPLF